MGLNLNIAGPLWFWFMLAALIFWSIRVLIDEFLTKGGNDQSSIYKESIYGTIISGRFAGYAAIPFAAVYFLKIRGSILLEDIVCLIVAGALYLLHYHYFFILLKRSDQLDAAWTESASSANLVLTPFILFLLINEKFNIIVLAGIAIVAISVSVLFIRTRNIVKNNKGILFCFIVTFSGSSILSDYAYEGNDGVWTILGLLGFFYFGMALCGQAFYLSIHDKAVKDDIGRVIKANFRFLSVAELIDLAGTFFFQVAIAVAPSIILALAMLEFMPIACMIIAAVLLCTSWNKSLKSIARAQFQEGFVKTFASLVTFVGAILIIGSGPIQRAFPDIILWANEVTLSTQKMVDSVTQQEGMTTDLRENSLDQSNKTNASTESLSILKPGDSIAEDIAKLYPNGHKAIQNIEASQLNNDDENIKACLQPWPDCLSDIDLLDQGACQFIYEKLFDQISQRLGGLEKNEFDAVYIINHATQQEINSGAAKCRYELQSLPFNDEVTAREGFNQINSLCPDSGKKYQTELSKAQTKNVQYWLSEYSKTHTSGNTLTAINSVDGYYGKSTCKAIAAFEFEQELPYILGILDQAFYEIIKGYNDNVSEEYSGLSRVNHQTQESKNSASPPSTKARSYEVNASGSLIEASPKTLKGNWERIKFCMKKQNRTKDVCKATNVKKSDSR